MAKFQGFCFGARGSIQFKLAILYAVWPSHSQFKARDSRWSVKEISAAAVSLALSQTGSYKCVD